MTDGAPLQVFQVVQELNVGGAERVVAALVTRLRAEGDQVAVATARSTMPELAGVTTTPLPLIERRLARVPAAALSLRRALGRERPAVVHAHNPAMALVTALATARGRATPAIVTMHGVPDEDYAGAARVLRLSGLPVVACGPGVADALAQNGLRVVETIVNGVSAADPSAPAIELKRRLGVGRAPVVVSVGRLVPQKNHALALQAFATVPSAALVVVGDGPLRGELAALADSLEIGERVHFTGTRNDARELIAASDALLLSSEWEGLPLVLLEALASGTPVVATAVRGVRELVRDGETALLAPPGDAQALAAAVSRVLGDRALADRLRVNGLRLAKRYSEERMCDRYLALYHSLKRH